jgi:cysteine sulfinate desulfinase/cysteine desulfurase-like protein
VAKRAIEHARRQVAQAIGARPEEVIFTSGGTESNNQALVGVARARRTDGRHVIVSSVEHPAVSEVADWLEGHGYEISRLPVDAYGRVHPDDLRQIITPETILVSVMHANNEVGTVQPIAALSAIAHEFNATFHTDAAQSVGKIPVDVDELGVDLLSVAGHKLYAPKGVGALYVRSGVSLEPLMHGADHESGRRPGTENVIEIVGLGAA